MKKTLSATLALIITTLINIACSNINTQNPISMDKKFQKIDPTELSPNVIDLIGNQWMLITAGKPEKFNMMTASWGGVGFLWGKPVAFVFVRPQRYTFGFMESEERFTLSFFGDEYTDMLTQMGTTSGRDVDKLKESGLSHTVTEGGAIAFTEAEIIIECRKIYADGLNPDAFVDKNIITENYPDSDYHKMYIGEITGVWVK